MQLRHYWFTALSFRTALKVYLLHVIKKRLHLPFNIFFSQTGEDILISKTISTFLKKIKSNAGGFYIDVGCNEPIIKSNTFRFYLERWKGITIDANAALIDKHKKIRKMDIPICAAVSDTVKEVVFYKSNTNAVSTISNEFYALNKDRWKYTQEEKLTTRTLTSILDENLPQDTEIDFMSVDVEGIDLEVLQGMNFEKYRPKLIIIELHGFSVDNKEKYPIYQLLTSNGYRLYAFATMNVYFIDSKLPMRTTANTKQY